MEGFYGTLLRDQGTLVVISRRLYCPPLAFIHMWTDTDCDVCHCVIVNGGTWAISLQDTEQRSRYVHVTGLVSCTETRIVTCLDEMDDRKWRGKLWIKLLWREEHVRRSRGKVTGLVSKVVDWGNNTRRCESTIVCARRVWSAVA